MLRLVRRQPAMRLARQASGRRSAWGRPWAGSAAPGPIRRMPEAARPPRASRSSSKPPRRNCRRDVLAGVSKAPWSVDIVCSLRPAGSPPCLTKLGPDGAIIGIDQEVVNGREDRPPPPQAGEGEQARGQALAAAASRGWRSGRSKASASSS